jgi:protein required for attachment to host cells
MRTTRSCTVSIARKGWLCDDEEVATALAHRVDRAVARGDISGWALLAAPETLGILRKALGKQAKDALIGDAAGDYVHQTIEKIERAVQAA